MSHILQGAAAGTDCTLKVLLCSKFYSCSSGSICFHSGSATVSIVSDYDDRPLHSKILSENIFETIPEPKKKLLTIAARVL